MKRSITGFHIDSEGHWVAELECGHGQHMRHQPPWMERDWVLTEEGRQSRIGQLLKCVRCDELALEILDKALPEIKKIASEEYESAGLSGLCGEGRLEAALGALDAKEILARTQASD
jgi:hypothetical protein